MLSILVFKDMCIITAICVQVLTANIFSRLFTAWKRDCHKSANAAAKLSFWHGKLRSLVIQSTTLFVLFLQTVIMWTGTYSIGPIGPL